MSEFVGDDHGDSLFVSGGGYDWVVQQGRLPVCDQTPVFHCPGVEVRQRDLIWRGEDKDIRKTESKQVSYKRCPKTHRECTYSRCAE